MLRRADVQGAIEYIVAQNQKIELGKKQQHNVLQVT
jgi:hypothetical protein